MSDVIVARSPLDDFIESDLRANKEQEPGLIIKERRNTLQLQLIARNNMSTRLSNLVTQFLGLEHVLSPMEGARQKGLFVCATGPWEYWVFANKPDIVDELMELQNMVEETASIFDQSEGRFVITLTGQIALNVLAKGSALDMQATGFPTQGATHTVIDHIPVLLVWQQNPARYDVCMPRSFTRSFMTWLCEASTEYGYKIERE